MSEREGNMSDQQQTDLADWEAMAAEWERKVAITSPAPWKEAWTEPMPRGKDLDDGPIVYSVAEGVSPQDACVIDESWYDGPLTGCTREHAAFIVYARNTPIGQALAAACKEVRRLAAANAKMSKWLEERGITFEGSSVDGESE